MATIVPVVENTPMRIGPKVFADIPSQRELDDARRAIDKMRRGRVASMLWLILLAGALIAAGAFIYLLLTRPVAVPADADNPVKLKEQIATLDASLTASRNNLEAAQKRYENFAGLPEGEENFKVASDKIAVFVADRPKYGDIKARTIRARPTPTREQWVVYERGLANRGRPIWKGEDAGQVKASIEQQVRDLEALLTQINATGPLPPGPGGCTNPDVTQC